MYTLNPIEQMQYLTHLMYTLGTVSSGVASLGCLAVDDLGHHILPTHFIDLFERHCVQKLPHGEDDYRKKFSLLSSDSLQKL
jgi:hypothetical protein